jgi:teichuronic acid biosynthesis glycosyltransferase TuaC
MRILAITNMLPTEQRPALGTFVEQQIRSLRDVGLDVDVLLVNRADKGMAAYFDLPKQFRMRFRSFQPDIVHVMYGGVMADLVTQAVTDVPTVVTFHGSDLFGENLSGLTRKLISRCGVWASMRAARRADGIIVVSSNLRSRLPNDIDEAKIRTIPCGIDLDRFKPLDQNECRDSLGWRSDVFHVLFPANSGDPVKRPELAKAAVDLVEHRGINIEMHELRGVPYQRVPLWINASDVLLMTSLHEGSPTIVKEALACNLPVVSVDVGDVAERVNGVDGCHLAMPNPRDLASRLLLVQAGRRRTQGREKIEGFSSAKIAGRLRSLYSELLSSKGGSTSSGAIVQHVP